MTRLITEEPNGINLAIITSANTLRNKLRSMWLQLKSKSKHRSKLIPAKVELCLFICSFFAFSKDSVIPIEDVVIYGMGLFEDVKDTIETRQLIHDFIDDLTTRGVIELCGVENNDENQYVKMLPDGHTLANLIASKYQLEFRHRIILGNWLVTNLYNNCYGLSLVFKKTKKYDVKWKCSKLGLLQVQYREDSGNIPINFFKGMKELRVLSLDVPSLTQGLDVLRNLHTLRLKLRRSADISAIRGLVNLEFLSISTSCLIVIPREMAELGNLRLLDLRNTNLAHIPAGVLSRMLKLKELYLPFSFTRWRCADEHDDRESGDENDYNAQEKNKTSIREINDRVGFGVSLDEITSLSLQALQISLPKASILAKKSTIFKSIQRFKILIHSKSKCEPLGEGQMNKLLLTGDACDIKESGICDLMCRTEDLSLIRVRNLKNILCQLEVHDYSELKKVIINECDELEQLVVTTESWTPCDPFCELESLHLSMLLNLKEVWHGTRSCFGWFENLRQINIRFCPKLKYVFPLSIARGLRQLKSINILECNDMEGVFFRDEGDDTSNDVYSIEEVDLHSLGNLAGFLVEKDNKIDEVQDDTDIQPLKTDEIVSTKMEGPMSALDDNFQPFPTNEGKSKVSEICIEGEESISTRKSQSSVTQHLASRKRVSHVECKGIIFHGATFYPFQLLQNLKRLRIAFCDVVEVIFSFEENHATTEAFNCLIELELCGLRNLMHIWYQVSSETIAFQNLQLLILSKCHNLYLCSSRVAKLLVQLKKVYISCCEKMEEIIAQEDEEQLKGPILFPRLKLLELQYMPKLKIFYSGTHVIEFPLLQSLRFNQCSKMKYFSNGWLRTPMLERIQINGGIYPLMRNVNATMEQYMGNIVGSSSNEVNPTFTIRTIYHPRAGPSRLTYSSSTTDINDSVPSSSAYTKLFAPLKLNGQISAAPNLKKFTFADLKSATRNFGVKVGLLKSLKDG